MSSRIAALAMALVAVAAATADAAPDLGHRPHAVLLANNSGTETTDLLVPLAVLRDAEVADVAIVAVEPGPVTLMPGLVIEPDATLADVTATPDLVVVPAMHDPTTPALLAAVRRWAGEGALVASICDGAWVLAYAGLLDGRTATSHWYSMAKLRDAYPHTRWRQDVRWVRDGNLVTSAGVSAALPLARHLAEQLGHGGLERTGNETGPPHDGARFTIAARDVWAGAGNYLLPWRHETVAVPLVDGTDELAAALTLDLLHRTYAVSTTTFATTTRVRSRRGVRLVPDVVAPTAPASDRTLPVGVADFDPLLADIEARYGAATRSLVALQIEYPPGRW